MNGLIAKKIEYIFFSLLLLLVFGGWYTLFVYQPDLLIIKIIGVFAIIQLVFILYTWKNLSGSYINAYSVFIIACYAFNIGQPILELFNATTPIRSFILHYRWPIDVYCSASFISLLFIMGLHIGAIISSSPKREKPICRTDFIIDILAIRKVSLIIAICTFPFYAYNTIINMIISATYGYEAIYEGGTGTIKIFQLLGEYYVPAVICLYFTVEVLKHKTKYIWGIILSTVIFPPLFIGGRSNAIIILAVILIVYSFFHKITWKKLSVIGLSAYLILTVFAAIAGHRGSNDRSLNSFTQVYSGYDNPVLFTLTEMSGSEQPLMHILNIVPDHKQYAYGQSYLFALTTIIPNMGFWDIHPATKYSNLGNWLRNYEKLPYGPGFSIVAEAYYNFGYWGFFMMILLGWGFAKIFSAVSNTELYQNPFLFIIAIIFLWLTIKMVRNSFEFSVRAVFYYCLPMYILMKNTAIRYKKNFYSRF